MLKRYLTLLICVGVSMMALGHSSPAQAQNQALAGVLGEVQWGDRKGDVLKKLRAEMLAKVNADESLKSDRVLMQEARRRALDEMKTVENSYKRLQGERTGFEVSVIAGEFTSNNGESVMRVRDQVAQRFYFFLDGNFYKLVVAYNPDYITNVGFEAFISQAARRYGRPEATDYGQVGGEEHLVLARWEDNESELRIENKKEFFATYTMSFTDLSTLKRLKSANRSFGGADVREEEVSSAVQRLSEFSVVDRNENVVDSLVGNTTVNLNEGRPKGEDLREGSDEGVASAPDDSSSRAQAAPKKKKKTTRKKTTKRDFSDLDTKGGDDLIIY
ncbi:MAG: hypothetical protein ACNA8W_01620 [Bradymonadaceae bacterium]